MMVYDQIFDPVCQGESSFFKEDHSICGEKSGQPLGDSPLAKMEEAPLRLSLITSGFMSMIDDPEDCGYYFPCGGPWPKNFRYSELSKFFCIVFRYRSS